ncbi:MAG: enoyl-CoA hydratase-related protein, partial [Syntrophales bacterium]|nr:enoyl-CoA hydratase-related protein [Syntrophales bacterium]
GDVLVDLQNQDVIRVVVIRGTGYNIFCSGADLSGDGESFKETIKGMEYCLTNLLNHPRPIIAMISRPAIGAGLDIAVISDFRIASETAQFGVPLVKLGRTYYYTAIDRLTNLLGIAAAKELLLRGKLIDAKRAMEIGLVNQVVPPGQLLDVTYSLAKELAEGNAPLAMRATKTMIRRLTEQRGIDPRIEPELKALADGANNSEDAGEGVRAMLEKRKPKFTGR